MFECVIEAIDVLLKAADDDLIDKLKSEGYINPAESVENINTLEDRLAEALNDQLDYYMQGLEGAELENVLENVLPALLAGDLTNQEIADIFKDVFDGAMRSLIDAYIKDIDKDLAFSMFSNRASDWIDSWSEELGQIMKLGSHNELQRILDNALDEGESIQTVMERLTDSYGFSRTRARATAITEMLTAHSYSKQEAILQSPAVDRKEWKHTGEHKNKPRPHHQALDGTIVDKNEPFVISAPNGTYEAMFPRDTALPASERVNCHCIHRAIVNEDILGLSLADRRALQQEAIDKDNFVWEVELNASNRAAAGIE
ncbi:MULTISPECIES: phage minor head protein [unclassified Dehalobacter]|uniref:phage minor head protein n=1 Tax=unclassified Dehalobacter TaxID=2635733 RepID=UPI001043C387|nr:MULTISPECIES: phage minor head protein [unclassified Dehalobacter]TCX51938.1 hypothetical protein C1I36_06370 [Dehalobacter sp. 14DCB1]TCX52998.1 hypothetical protein C1I38_08050 [Dehalobacter sp. 12DCB1]